MTRGRWFLEEINPNPGSYLSGKIPYRQFYSLIQQQFGQRLLAVPWVQQRGIQIQPGCIYYFTGTRVLYGSGWSGRLKRQHDTGRVVDAQLQPRRHRWRAVRGAFYMPPRLTARLHRFHGRYGYRAGVGGRRAAQWQEHSPGNLRLSGCSWKCFARYWYSGLTTKCLVNTKKSSPPTVSRLNDEKYRRFERRRYRRVLISRGWGNDEKCLR